MVALKGRAVLLGDSLDFQPAFVAKLEGVGAPARPRMVDWSAAIWPCCNKVLECPAFPAPYHDFAGCAVVVQDGEKGFAPVSYDVHSLMPLVALSKREE